MIYIICHQCRSETVFDYENSNGFETTVACSTCGAAIARKKYSNGFVYAFTNGSMPGLIKIGRTDRTIKERIDELNTTGVPSPFSICFVFSSNDSRADEQLLHEELKLDRVGTNREFFVTPPSTALEIACKIFRRSPVAINRALHNTDGARIISYADFENRFDRNPSLKRTR